ncbi:MAG: hypothetical protein NTW54_09055 [Bacteroidetes bacterium]|nr:hypothetical protein [Bacteroidota bacterium]
MDKLKINNDWFGVAIGILLPAALFGVAMGIKGLIHYMVTTPFLLILCVGANFLPVLFYTKHNLDKTSRGLVLVTLFFGLLFFYYKIFIIQE